MFKLILILALTLLALPALAEPVVTPVPLLPVDCAGMIPQGMTVGKQKLPACACCALGGRKDRGTVIKCFPDKVATDFSCDKLDKEVSLQ